MPEKRVLGPLLMLAAVVTVACGCTSAGSSGSGLSGTPAPTTAAATAATSPSDPATTAVLPTRAACSSKDFKVLYSPLTRLDGQSIDAMSVENVSKAPCPVRGYATIELHGKGGARIKTAELHGGTIFGPKKPGSYVLQPHQYIGFNLQASATGAGCWTALTMKLKMPGAHDWLNASTTSDDRGYHGCGTKLRVAPFFGTVATA